MNYIKRLQLAKAEEAANQTEIKDNCIELVSYSLEDIDMNLYL